MGARTCKHAAAQPHEHWALARCHGGTRCPRRGLSRRWTREARGAHCAGRARQLELTRRAVVVLRRRAAARLVRMAPSAGLEPAHTAPEADALSAELRGQGANRGTTTLGAGVSAREGRWSAPSIVAVSRLGRSEKEPPTNDDHDHAADELVLTQREGTIPPDVLDEDSRPRRVDEIVQVEVAGEQVIIGGRWGGAAILNPTGALVWQFLDGEATLGELVDDFSDAMEAPRDVVHDDVLGFARSLGYAGLLVDVEQPYVDLDAVGATPPIAFEDGQELEPFSATTLDGSERSLHDFAGRQVYLVNWNPGCGYCDSIAESLAALEVDLEAVGTQLVLAAAGGEASNRVLVDRVGLRAPVLLKPDRVDPFGGLGTPAALVLDADGRVVGDLAMGAREVPERAAQLAGVELAEGRGALPSGRRRNVRCRRDQWTEDVVGRNVRLRVRRRPRRHSVQQRGDRRAAREAARRRTHRRRRGARQLLGRPHRSRQRLQGARAPRPRHPADSCAVGRSAGCSRACFATCRTTSPSPTRACCGCRPPRPSTATGGVCCSRPVSPVGSASCSRAWRSSASRWSTCRSRSSTSAAANSSSSHPRSNTMRRSSMRSMQD